MYIIYSVGTVFGVWVKSLKPRITISDKLIVLSISGSRQRLICVTYYTYYMKKKYIIEKKLRHGKSIVLITKKIPDKFWIQIIRIMNSRVTHYKLFWMAHDWLTFYVVFYKKFYIIINDSNNSHDKKIQINSYPFPFFYVL